MTTYHVPVLLRPSIDHLMTNAQGIYVDATYGGGGHAKEILHRLDVKGRLVALDRDYDSFDNRIEDDRLTLIKANFRHLQKHLRAHNIKLVDGVLADLGVSSHQFDDDNRGFTFRSSDVKLDMRMSSSSNTTAIDILNSYSQEKLWRMFSEYGEVRNAKTLAKGIVDARSIRAISNSQELESAVDGLLRGSRVKYLAKVYQALRIEVNDEMEALKEMLGQCRKVIKPGGRLVVISYHSLEDRIVKRFLKNGGWIDQEDMEYRNKCFREISRKIIEPDNKEIEINIRARSAKMRVGEKI